MPKDIVMRSSALVSLESVQLTDRNVIVGCLLSETWPERRVLVYHDPSSSLERSLLQPYFWMLADPFSSLSEWSNCCWLQHSRNERISEDTRSCVSANVGNRKWGNLLSLLRPYSCCKFGSRMAGWRPSLSSQSCSILPQFLPAPFQRKCWRYTHICCHSIGQLWCHIDLSRSSFFHLSVTRQHAVGTWQLAGA